MFYGFHSLTDFFDLETYGIEYQYMSGPISVEFRAGAAQIYDNDACVVNVDADYAYGDFDFGAGIGYVANDEVAATRISLNGAYTLTSFYNTELFAQYSYLTGSGSSYNMSRFEVGLRIPFGAGNKKPFSNPNDLVRDVSIFLD